MSFGGNVNIFPSITRFTSGFHNHDGNFAGKDFPAAFLQSSTTATIFIGAKEKDKQMQNS